MAGLLTLDGQEIPEQLRPHVDLLLGIALSRQGLATEAAGRLDAAAADPLLGDYALYHLAKARQSAGQPELAAAALDRLVAQHPQSLFRERAARELPRAFFDAGQLDRAEETARQYLAASRSSAGRGEVWLTLGETLLRAGRSAEAEELLRRVWIESPSSPESQRAAELLAQIPDARRFTADEEFQRAVTLFQLGQHALVIPELTPFAADGSPRQTLARLMLGVSAFNVRQYSQAARWLEPLQNAPGPERPEALFWLGRSAGRAGDAAKFTDTLTRLVDTAPQSRRSEEALYLLAQDAADNADVAKSRAYLGRLLKAYPKGSWTDVALWLQGWLAYTQAEYPAAAAAWGRLVAEESGSRWKVPALYWRGRALEGAKRASEAAQTYRTLLDGALDQYYYRMRAGERLARLTKKAPARSIPPPAPPLGTGSANGVHARKGRALQKLGLADEAVEEWSEHVRSHPDQRTGLAEACRVFLDLGRFDKAVWVGSRVLRPLFVQGAGAPPIPGFWECTYPLGHIDLVQQHAASRGVDPFLVLGLIREESAFAPQAVSRTGARGLMQLMPQTADLTAREDNLRPVAPAELETPERNIEIGVNHLADLLREFNGNLSLALAAYN
ncbi:MAG TPA: transglycosylase SLT domain-containing protein, partial [Gemmatimonadales bacterium]|nr:transglycosylase SLT domain-containing protein [Gemmatimonadales bacterium]